MTWKEKHQKIQEQKLLVVGAGGIGCELLKNLAATGFRKVHVIDLDTIDISNLNRQFLFRKEHVSCSKAEVATRVVKQFCPAIDLTYDHDSIFEEKFNIDFFKSFDFVMNALDNRKARNHVNRMCHAARRPLIESGSAGYFGQVSVIIREKTECYECVEKPAQQKTFPGCTIRNTPSEHIHCTVWAKHVFNQLFGEVDIDDDVSPDMKAEDGENGDQNGEKAPDSETEEPAPIGTRQWAEGVDFDPQQVFDKLFQLDIEYLCKMEHLWKQRKQPTPIAYSTALETEPTPLSYQNALKNDTSVWTLSTCAQVFADCVKQLREQIRAQPDLRLSFEKDEPTIMAFVAAVANIRATIFSIGTKSMFEIKAMAGNIIPAIAATNAIVAGMMVTEAIKLVHGEHEKARNAFIRNQPNPRGKIFADEPPAPPNPKCYVCSETREVFIYVNPTQMTVSGLCEKVLKSELNMLDPDVMDNASSRIIISSDGDTDDLLKKKLSELAIEDGAILSCDDFQQDMVLKLFIRRQNDLKGDEFKILREETDGEKEKEEDKRKRKPDGEEDVEPEVKRPKIVDQVEVCAE
uniref:SUMO-activating enzyme subunit n=1 Tax=Caenorhabditis japonica TaxID=281687 RepID=A0A8R1HSM0_CAEJA